MSPKTLPATINPSPTRLVAIPPTNNVPKVSPRSLEAILNSPRFPEGYHEPIWRILDATEKIKRFLRVGDEGIAGAEFVKGRGLMENELKGLWVQLEVIGEVVSDPIVSSFHHGCGVSNRYRVCILIGGELDRLRASHQTLNPP